MRFPIQLDGSLEVGAIFHRNAFGLDLAEKIRFFGNFDLAQCIDGPLQLTADADVLSPDFTINPAVGSDREIVLFQIDIAFQRSLYDQVFFTFDLAFDGDVYTDGGFFLAGC